MVLNREDEDSRELSRNTRYTYTETFKKETEQRLSFEISSCKVEKCSFKRELFYSKFICDLCPWGNQTECNSQDGETGAHMMAPLSRQSWWGMHDKTKE